MSIVTGVSTADEFLSAINDKGASLTNESTAYDLATAIDATGGNVSWQSPNEVVVEAVNAEIPPEPPTTVDITLVVHYATPESENHYYKLILSGASGVPTVNFPLIGLTPGDTMKNATKQDAIAYASSNFAEDLSKLKITIGKTSYVSTDIKNITYAWLSGFIETDSSGVPTNGLPDSFLKDDVVPDANVTIEVFEVGYTE